MQEKGCMRAKPLQLCQTLCDPMDYSQPGSSVHEDSPGKNIGVGCHALLQGIFPIQGLNPALLSPALAGGFFTASATWEVRGEKKKANYDLLKILSGFPVPALS